VLKLKAFTFSPIQENTYVLYNQQNQCAIIDPGCYFDTEREALANFITQQQLTPVLLLNTHCHLDHVFGNKFVAETYNLQPHIHPAEKKMLDMAPTSGLMYNLPFDNYVGDVLYYQGGTSIALGQDALTLIDAPGHSPGSVCLYSQAHNFLIGGDVLFYESIGRTDLPFGNHQQLINSITQNIFTLPNQTVVHSGHGKSTTIGHEKANNPYLK
jgi:hydroxyacylglutathione hydrolase